jgi:Lon protease-like protein
MATRVGVDAGSEVPDMALGRDTITVPLFLVNAVLFPGTRLRLHVFEERYRRMVADCLDRDAPFGVVAIRAGAEVGGPAEPYSAGTLARIVDHEALEGGRLLIRVAGTGRFSLLSYRQAGKLLVGQIKFQPDHDERPSRILRDEAYALASEYQSFIQEPDEPRGPVPAEAEALSYWIARRLPLKLSDQQELLEQRQVAQRLAWEIGLLRQLLDQLRMPQSN